MENVLRSKAVWTAFLGFLGVIIAYYTEIPADIWQSFVLFVMSLVAIFAIDEGAEAFGKSMGKTLYELREKDK